MTHSPALCATCGWYGIASNSLDGPTVLWECPRCGFRWRTRKPMEVKAVQKTLEGFK